MTHPLSCSLRHGSQAVVGAVLDAGANVNATFDGRRHSDQPAKTVMDMAFDHNEKSLLKCLIGRGATMPPQSSWSQKKKSYTMIREVALANGATNVPTWEKLSKAWRMLKRRWGTE